MRLFRKNRLFIWIISVMLMVSLVTIASASNSDAKTIVLDEANVRLDNTIGWNCLTRNDMGIDALKAGGYSQNSFTQFAEDNNIYLYCFTNNRSDIITVRSFYDSFSENIYCLNDATYNSQQEFITRSAELGVIPSGAVITKSNEKQIVNDQALMYVLEYYYQEGRANNYGYAYVTIQNGCYIVIDLTSAGTEIEKSTLSHFKNLMNSVAFLRIEGKPLITKDKLIYIGGGVVIVLFVILIIRASKNKKKY